MPKAKNLFNVILYQPEIPPNTGNIMRLCTATQCALHLIEPLGFHLTDKHLKRAKLDYDLSFPLQKFKSFEECQNTLPDSSRIYLCSTKANTPYTQPQFKSGDSFVFGPETRGLPETLLSSFPESQKIRIPMCIDVRSLNLANSVAIVIYEAWRQLGFACNP